MIFVGLLFGELLKVVHVASLSGRGWCGGSFLPGIVTQITYTFNGFAMSHILEPQEAAHVA